MAKAKKDELDRFVEEVNKDPMKLAQLMFWLGRHRNPEMALQITAKDLKGFADCMSYLDVKPQIVVQRPQGRPAQAAIPATAKRKGVPARPAEAPRPFVAVNLVAAGTMNAIKPIENDEAGAELRDQGDAVRRFKDKAPVLAQQLQSDVQRREFSSSTILESAQALVTLAGAV